MTAVLDRRLARAVALAVAPSSRSDPAAAARLRTAVAADLPAVDAAARRWTGLDGDLGPTTVRVLGRAAWVEANLDSLEDAFAVLGQRLRAPELAARVLGAQVGLILGLLSGKVIGQYILPLGRRAGGELVVVGPNLLQLERELGARAPDVRRVVLLHEVTHRLQFGAAPWLADHLRRLLDRYLEHARVDPAALWRRLRGLPDAVAAARRGGTVEPLLETVLEPAQVEVVREAQALMTLLEGHATAAMYAAADGLVADVEAVRRLLTRRRSDLSTRILTAVAGLDLKRRQYREGEGFVTAVVARAGVAGLNRAFSAPELLPTPEEIRDPERWLRRTSPEGGAH